MDLWEDISIEFFDLFQRNVRIILRLVSIGGVSLWFRVNSEIAKIIEWDLKTNFRVLFNVTLI